ncbi:hypothetical protein AAVH_17464 [Aphelenchoides avenae]|nr:hypothetical protein AAVH_17464 [Aphelenchus avenae]
MKFACILLIVSQLVYTFAVPVFEANGKNVQLALANMPAGRARRGAIKGAILGALGGAAVGHFTGAGAGKGALLGAGAGGLAGHFLGRKNKNKAMQQQMPHRF